MNPPTLNRPNKATILVVEDEAIVRADVEDYLKSFGYRVAAAIASPPRLLPVKKPSVSPPNSHPIWS